MPTAGRRSAGPSHRLGPRGPGLRRVGRPPTRTGDGGGSVSNPRVAALRSLRSPRRAAQRSPERGHPAELDKADNKLFRSVSPFTAARVEVGIPRLSPQRCRRARPVRRSSVRGGCRNPAPTTGCRAHRDRAWLPRPGLVRRPARRRRWSASRCGPRSERSRGGAASGRGRVRAARDRPRATACRRRRSTDHRGFVAWASTHRAKSWPCSAPRRPRTAPAGRALRCLRSPMQARLRRATPPLPGGGVSAWESGCSDSRGLSRGRASGWRIRRPASV